jgi:signal transduction histidine kinase/CheY-like chemotaxis protein
MNLGRRTFTSKVARRAFALFVGCALLPVSILAIISLRQVTSELRAQSERRLRQASKSVGLNLHQRLMALDALIDLDARPARTPDNTDSPAPFTAIVLTTADGQSRPLLGQLTRAPELTPDQAQQINRGHTILDTEPGAGGETRFLLIRARDKQRLDAGVLIGEINPAYLWVPHDTEALEAGTQLVVLDEAGRRLISSFEPGAAVADLGKFPRSGSSGQFTWNDGAQDFVASYWSLFLKNQFLTDNWIIILNRGTTDILAPIADFHRIFALVCVLSLLVVLFLSVGQIRKILEPLAQLQVATRRLALGHLDSRVEVRSRDEFADLAASFNQMAAQLARQFDALTMRSEITVALSRSERADEVLRQCMAILVRHLDLATVGVWLSGTAGTSLELRAIAGAQRCTDGAPKLVPVGTGEIGRVAADRRPCATDALAQDPRQHNPAWTTREGLVAFVGHPLLIEGRVQGVAAAYATRPLDVIDLGSIASAFGEIAQGIERRRAAESLRDSEEQVRQLQKMEAMGRLTSGIAHDFNNLLTVVMCSSHVLVDGLAPADPRHQMANLIQDTSQRASKLTQQLLAFTRKQVVAPALLDLNTVATEMSHILQRLVGDGIKLHIPTATGLGLVNLDRGQIEQVLVNLVVNARDATSRGGSITIETADVAPDERDAAPSSDAKRGPQVMLKVTDTGTGMDAATQAKIFDAFFTTKGPGKGTGLGLATVQSIVAQNGGTIQVESKLGHGSSFILRFPRAAGAGTLEQSPVADLPPARGHETVLLVEDEYEVRILLHKILADYGYTVMSVGRPFEALRTATCHVGPIHLLITDRVMPQMSGAVLAERLVAERPDMAVLQISGYGGDRPADGAEPAADTAAFLQKPFTPVVFARKVRAVLDSTQAPVSAKKAA